MNISAIQPKLNTEHLDLQSLAGNQALSEQQKIAEASRQFEMILLRQFLSEAQKPMIQGALTDNSSVAGIYQDMVSTQLADAMSQGKGIGLAESFQKQLTPHHTQTSEK